MRFRVWEGRAPPSPAPEASLYINGAARSMPRAGPRLRYDVPDPGNGEAMTQHDDAIRIFIDADACPVKDETYRVAQRYGLHVFVVANSYMMIPAHPRIERVVVDAGPDIADDWIADNARPGDVVVTNDIPLAERALAAGAAAIGANGRPFTRDSIGSAIAQRAIMEQIRSTGVVTGGPPPFGKADRSRFLQALDEAINREMRKRR